MIPLLLMLACDNKEPVDDSVSADDSAVNADDSSTDDSVADDSADDSGQTGEFSCAEFDAPVPTLPARRFQSTVTWTLDFSEEAEANGLYDCSYSRTYEAIERVDLPFLCPDCSLIVEGDATLTEGADCSAQISTSGTVRTELWGLSDDGRLFRTSLEQGPMSELTTLTLPAEGEWGEVFWDSTSELSAGGTMYLAANGQIRFETDNSTLLVDHSTPRTTPYSAGWEQNDPGNLTLDYTPALGETFPNARFEDQCHDWVDLWDFYGSYLVIDNSQPDCGPCQNMAAGEADFVAGLRAEGIPVRVITLMGAGLSQSTTTPPASTVDAWISRFGVDEPMLYDRGFGYAMFAPFLEDFSGEDFGYPAWVIVDPEMTLIYGNIGFGNWDSVASVIRDDWSSR